MKKCIPSITLFFCCLLLASCNTAGPEKYFDMAVLNSNMLVGFADEWHLKQLENPSVKLDEKGQTVPMPRTEFLGTRLTFVEEAFEKLKDLKETADTKEMLQISLALYEYVIPVYKTEYVQLAGLYDQGASKEKIQSMIKAIHNKYYPRYNELYNKLIGVGKLYAERHAIKVNWAL